MKTKVFSTAFIILSFCFFIISCQKSPQVYTKGIGVYPGNPTENFSPELKPDNGTYRNIALNRTVFHSSSYDYNLTGQLITDGIISSEIPPTISVSTTNGELPKNEREWMLDHNRVTANEFEAQDGIVQIEFKGAYQFPEMNRLSLKGRMTYDENQPEGFSITCQGSDDGENWVILKSEKGAGLPGFGRPNQFSRLRAQTNGKEKKENAAPPRNPFLQSPYGDGPDAPRPSFSFNFGMPKPSRSLDLNFDLDPLKTYRFYRVSIGTSCATSWSFSDLDFYQNDKRLNMVPSYQFSSSWMPAEKSNEWVYVDLGNESKFDKINLYWVEKPASAKIQVSDDASSWKDLVDVPDNQDKLDQIEINENSSARYVRLFVSDVGNACILSEVEIMGTGGLVVIPHPVTPDSEGKITLSGGNWKIQRASEVSDPGSFISAAGFDDSNWQVATVPGTVLVSYRNAGTIPDPNYGDNQLQISESFFYSDFWYRNEFEVPESVIGRKLFLNFDGINWKATVYVNGTKAGNIEGAFTRGIFDVSELIKSGTNSIAVLIKKNDNIGIVKEQTQISPDKNGGVLGADNPTFHASIGWDWIPTIRGRNIGIWNDVSLTTAGNVTIENPFVRTELPLPDTTQADLIFEITLKNHDSAPISGTLKGKYGDIEFNEAVSLAAQESKMLKLDPSTHPEFHITNPKLWWPKGYGVPNLYDVELSFETAEGVSDQVKFKSGVREMTHDENDGILNLYINGRRFIGRGGNWGFPESNLEYRGREYDIAVALHADMNFTMIRNWVGQTGDDEFFEACDRHGIMIWQDFWLANPADGPDPNDPRMFMDNAADFVKRIRNHPSIALYCGRNEGNPPEVIDTALRAMLPELHPGIHYISHSSSGVVSGGGPYRALPVRDYFLLYGFNLFHSERGMPNVMNFESLKQMLPVDKLWPQNSEWGIHDYCLEGAQGAASFNEIIEKAFGPINDAKRFTELAQWINYNGYRGIFEGRSQFRKGMLLWMSHSAWPSMVWQTYDYYFDPTAAYFGCKKASEPIHVQWNPVFNDVEVVNYSAGNQENLDVKAVILNMDGSLQWEKEATVNSTEDSTEQPFRLEFGDQLSDVHFIKLTLSKEGKVISENFYVRGKEDGNYQALNSLPKAKPDVNTALRKEGDEWQLSTTVKNNSETPLLMIRLKVTDDKGERMLPVFYSDNYFSLMPGEEKQIIATLKNEDTRGSKPTIEISGFNIEK